MVPAENLIDAGDPFAWADAFLVLAVHRCRPFFADMGVPGEIDRTPAPAVTIAREFTALHMAALQDDETFRLRMVDVLRNAMHQLWAVYPKDSIQQFLAWAVRSFVDHDQQRAWRHWEALLAGLTHTFDDIPPPPPSPLPPAALERFQITVRRRINWAFYEQLEVRLDEARTVPLDGDEQQWIYMVLDKDPHDVTLISLAIGVENAYQTWRELASLMTADEQTAVVEWARVAAATMQAIRPETMQRPPLDPADLQEAI